MIDVIKRNELARKAAASAGRQTYRHDVIDTWEACVMCARPIRRNVDRPGIGLFRACGCDGVVWRMSPAGGQWERVEESDG